MSEWVDVCAEADLPPGGRKVVTTPAGMVAVFNLDGALYAIEDVCTHDGGELASGRVEGDEIVCPRHGARFCLRDGRALSPPAWEDIETFPVRVREGIVQVAVDA
ncbi:MAG: non-heme iron oxygenase ferredoxin subunit [Mariprofundaceae bacterium]